MVLIGNKTRYLYRFVRWEMEQALDLDLAIVGVNLNGLRQQDSLRCPPLIREELAVHVSFNAAIVRYALEHWPASHTSFRQQHKSGAHYYLPSIYSQLGL